MACEHRVLIRDDSSRQAVNLVDLLHAELSYRRCGVGVSKWKEVAEPGAFVHNPKQAIEFAGLWESVHKIHGYHFPWLIGNWQRKEEPW